MTINKSNATLSDSSIGSTTSINIANKQQNNADDNLRDTILDSLKNHFLIAMPSLTDPYFKQSVVYLCEHDEQGAMGFIINYPIKLTIQALLKNAESVDHEPNPPLTEPVFLGGPLGMDRGFVLHTPTEDDSQSAELNEHLRMSNSNHILSTLGTAQAPEQYMVTLGYSSWDAGQLEEELKRNDWLTIASNNDIIFNTPIEKRWSVALKTLGVDPSQLTTAIGHA